MIECRWTYLFHVVVDSKKKFLIALWMYFCALNQTFCCVKRNLHNVLAIFRRALVISYAQLFAATQNILRIFKGNACSGFPHAFKNFFPFFFNTFLILQKMKSFNTTTNLLFSKIMFMEHNGKRHLQRCQQRTEQTLNEQLAVFGSFVLFQYFMYILVKFSAVSRSSKPIAQFNTFLIILIPRGNPPCWPSVTGAWNSSHIWVERYSFLRYENFLERILQNFHNFVTQ